MPEITVVDHGLDLDGDGEKNVNLTRSIIYVTDTPAPTATPIPTVVPEPTTVPEPTVVPKISLSQCEITVKDQIDISRSIRPAPVVKYRGKRLIEGIDFAVSYKNNRSIGTATVTVTGIGNYAESVDVKFKINPKSVALSKLKAGAKQLTVKWKKGKGVTGYQVQYSLKKDFSGAKTVTVKKAGTVETVLKKLTAGKTYYVRIRTYATVKGKKYYSEWSKAKSAKVK